MRETYMIVGTGGYKREGKRHIWGRESRIWSSFAACFSIFNQLVLPSNLPWRRFVLQTEMLLIIMYIFIHIWFLVCCVALVLLHSVITYFDARIKISFHRPWSGSIFSASGFLLLHIICFSFPFLQEKFIYISIASNWFYLISKFIAQKVCQTNHSFWTKVFKETASMTEAIKLLFVFVLCNTKDFRQPVEGSNCLPLQSIY